MEIKLNLASRLYLDRRRTRSWLMLFCALLLLALGFNGYCGYRDWGRLQLLDRHLQELEEQASHTPGVGTDYTPERYAAVMKEIALDNGIVAADRFHWTNLLSRFEELLPANASIRSIQPDYAKHSLLLNGVARDVSAMTLFIDNLLASPDLKQVYLQSHAEVESEQDGRKQLLVSFSLQIREAF